jgi:hypothetical protein
LSAVDPGSSLLLFGLIVGCKGLHGIGEKHLVVFSEFGYGTIVELFMSDELFFFFIEESAVDFLNEFKFEFIEVCFVDVVILVDGDHWLRPNKRRVGKSFLEIGYLLFKNYVLA